MNNAATYETENYTETVHSWIRQASASGRAYCFYHESWQPHIDELVADGSVIEIRLADLSRDELPLEERVFTDHEICVTGYWVRDALVARLRRNATESNWRSTLSTEHPTHRSYYARQAERLTAVANRLSA